MICPVFPHNHSMQGKRCTQTHTHTLYFKWLLLFQLHGRSREQRYTRLADWDYIKTCAQAAAPMPLLGQFVEDIHIAAWLPQCLC